MGSPERDLYKTATTVGGLPTCTFPAVSYNRVITNIVVNNSVTSFARVYRGLLGSTPVAQTTLGFSNTLKGRLAIPAGQQFFVQWSAAGSPVSSAFARVSSEREDGPFSGSSAQVEWSENDITSLTIPTGATGSRIVIGNDIPAQILAIPDFVPTAAIVFYFDSVQYYFEAVGQWVSALVPVVLKGTFDNNNGIVIYEVNRPNFLDMAFGTFVFDSKHPTYEIRDADLSIETGSDFLIDNISQSRGIVSHIDSKTLNVGDNTNEFTILTAPNMIFRTGRTYRIRYRFGTYTAGGVDNQISVKVRKGTGTGGTLWYDAVYTNKGTFNQETRYGEFYVRNTTGPDVTTTFTVTGIALISIHVGVTSSATDVAYLDCEDVTTTAAFVDAFEVS